MSKILKKCLKDYRRMLYSAKVDIEELTNESTASKETIASMNNELAIFSKKTIEQSNTISNLRTQIALLETEKLQGEKQC